MPCTPVWFLFRFGLHTGCAYDMEHEKPDYSYPCVHGSYPGFNSTAEHSLVYGRLTSAATCSSICVCVLIIISRHVFHFSWVYMSHYPGFYQNTPSSSVFTPTLIRVFFFFSFVTPSCLYFVVVRNPSLTPAVYTIKLTFIYVALFFLTRLQGALERKKQTADEAAQIKRNK